MNNTDTNQAEQLNETAVMRCFNFGYNDEYPNGFVSITKENAEKLQKHGWNVSFHTDYYLNTINVNYKSFSIGFGSWMQNLSAFIETNGYEEIVEIKNIEQLEGFLKIMQSTFSFANIA